MSEHRIVFYVVLDPGKDPVYLAVLLYPREPDKPAREWLRAEGKSLDAAVKNVLAKVPS